jgi:rare lipoprotein A
MASWYGQELRGRPTANGEPFDPNGLTAAHRTLPFGSCVRVERIGTERSVEVRVNDRGPFVRGRIIDLSARAARMLGIAGVAPVRLSPCR